MLIGEALLKSSAFSPRLTLLLQDLQNAGYTVWLEGLRLRFDLDAGAEPDDLAVLMKRYRDVAEWSPEPRTEFFEVSPSPRAATSSHSKRLLKGTDGTKVN